MSPLNPDLFEALAASFGTVLIANEGERARVDYRPSWGSPKGQVRLKAVRTVSGEYYRVDCPFCTDTRKRLWINHQ